MGPVAEEAAAAPVLTQVVATEADNKYAAYIEALQRLQPDELTPRAALDALYKLQALMPEGD